MSLLDKQEVQDIVGTLYCALENGEDLYVNERQKIRHYRARSAEERRRKRRRRRRRRKRRRRRMPNRDFFTSRGAYVKLRYIAMSVPPTSTDSSVTDFAWYVRICGNYAPLYGRVRA